MNPNKNLEAVELCFNFALGKFIFRDRILKFSSKCKMIVWHKVPVIIMCLWDNQEAVIGLDVKCNLIPNNEAIWVSRA